MTKYSDLSEQELTAMIQDAEKALQKKKDAQKKAVIQQIESLAASIGVKVIIEDERKSSPRKGSRVPPKYRNPENSMQTWSGRGVMPKWMQTLIDEGQKKSDFLISN